MSTQTNRQIMQTFAREYTTVALAEDIIFQDHAQGRTCTGRAEVEALLHTVNLAMEYRQRFHTDVFIDILCYRKYGHNEGDEPRFTQPLLYKAIAKHPNTRDIYAEHLIEVGIHTEQEIEQYEQDYDEILEEKLKASKELKKVYIQRFLKEDWKGFKYASQADFQKHVETGVTREKLLKVAEEINTLPEDKPFFSKIARLVDERKKAVKEEIARGFISF